VEARTGFQVGRRTAIACLLLLTILGGVARFRALDRGLPHLVEPDAAIVQRAMSYELSPDAYTDSAYPSTLYPFLLSGILAIAPGHNLTRAAEPGSDLRAHLAAASAPYVRGRMLVALISLLAIPATYLLARTWMSRPWSLAAAALMAACAQYLDLSIKAKPHVPLAALTVVALAASVRLVRSSRLRDHAIAGACVALAVACLHSGVFVVPAFVVATFLGARIDGRWRARLLGLALAGAFVALAVVLSYPFAMPWAGGQPDGSTTLDVGQIGIRWESWDGSGFGKMVPGLWPWDPWLVIGAAFGSALLVALALRDPASRRGPRAAAVLVVATHAACTIVAFGWQGQFYPRFLLPLMPTCAVLTAFAVRVVARAVAQRVADERARPIVTATVALALLAPPLVHGVRHALAVARDDTREQVAQWIEANVAPDDPVLLGWESSLPLREEDDELRRLPGWLISPWQRYQRDFLLGDESLPRRKLRSAFARGVLRDGGMDLDEALARIDECGARWVVSEDAGEVHAHRDQLENAARARGAQAVARFGVAQGGAFVRLGNPMIVWRMP